MLPKVYVALPTCNVETLILPVLNRLIKNTTVPFVLSISDNASTDNTYTVIKHWANNLPGNTKLQRLYMSRLPTRESSCVVINEALSRAKSHPEVEMIAKLDHDYGVPESWAEEMLLALGTGQYTLLCPSVVSDTPKGMQYYSNGDQPLKHTFPNGRGVWHYEGIAGYCHCFTPETLTRLGGYRPLTPGAVFGSEDADWSLRCGPVETKGYVMSLEGHHWTKPSIGVWEDKWKGEATFGRTHLTWEEWAQKNVPSELMFSLRDIK